MREISGRGDLGFEPVRIVPGLYQILGGRVQAARSSDAREAAIEEGMGGPCTGL